MAFVGLSKRMKRVGRLKNNDRTTIQCIPKEMVEEVFVRVASSSFPEILNAMLSCKNFREVGNVDYIYKHVSLENFPVIPWKKSDDTAFVFFDRCKTNQNPEALYRQGVIDYFSNAKLESGLESLKKSADAGHLGALYAVGIIYLLSEFKSEKQAGMGILKSMMKSESRKRMRECREKLNEILKCSWRREGIVVKQRARCCLKRDPKIHSKTGFPEVDSDGEYARLQCDACECDRELSYVLEYCI